MMITEWQQSEALRRKRHNVTSIFSFLKASFWCLSNTYDQSAFGRMDKIKNSVTVYRIDVSRSRITKIMTTVLTRVVTTVRRNISVFSRPENCPSVSDVVLISSGRLCHADGPATEKLRRPRPAVLVRGTTRSPWPAERKWRRVGLQRYVYLSFFCRFLTNKVYVSVRVLYIP